LPFILFELRPGGATKLFRLFLDSGTDNQPWPSAAGVINTSSIAITTTVDMAGAAAIGRQQILLRCLLLLLLLFPRSGASLVEAPAIIEASMLLIYYARKSK
jgi:hypothetical protein